MLAFDVVISDHLLVQLVEDGIKCTWYEMNTKKTENVKPNDTGICLSRIRLKSWKQQQKAASLDHKTQKEKRLNPRCSIPNLSVQLLHGMKTVRSQRWGYVRIIAGTILGVVLGFYVMHCVEISYKKKWDEAEKMRREKENQVEEAL
ncbi:hypothetical protein Ancab_019407 [Ancistrocladus abbreviatus]